MIIALFTVVYPPPHSGVPPLCRCVIIALFNISLAMPIDQLWSEFAGTAADGCVRFRADWSVLPHSALPPPSQWCTPSPR